MKNIHYTFDYNIKVGDYVLSSHNYDYIFVVTKIERRFADKDYIKHFVGPIDIGSEYNPLVTIKSVADLRFFLIKSSKLERTLDGSFLSKFDPMFIENHILKLREILEKFHDKTL